jgi:hypothetical protein
LTLKPSMSSCLQKFAQLPDFESFWWWPTA